MKECTAIVAEAPMTQREHTDFKRLENDISKYLFDYKELGQALGIIKDKRLYRETHKTFEAYCQDRWDLSREMAYHNINAAEVALDLKDFSYIPANAAQANVLHGLKREDRRKVWKQATENLRGGKLTKAKLEAVLEEVKGVAAVRVTKMNELGSRILDGMSGEQKVEFIKGRQEEIERQAPEHAKREPVEKNHKGDEVDVLTEMLDMLAKVAKMINRWKGNREVARRQLQELIQTLGGKK